MTWDEARQVIYNALLTPWAAAHSTATVYFPGQEYPDLNERTAPFLMFRVQPRRTEQSGLHGPTDRPKRRWGIVEADIMVPEKTGDKTIFSMIATLESLFTATGISGIVFTNTVIPNRSTAVGWTSQMFLASFYFD